MKSLAMLRAHYRHGIQLTAELFGIDTPEGNDTAAGRLVLGTQGDAKGVGLDDILGDHLIQDARVSHVCAVAETEAHDSGTEIDAIGGISEDYIRNLDIYATSRQFFSFLIPSNLLMSSSPSSDISHIDRISDARLPVPGTARSSATYWRATRPLP